MDVSSLATSVSAPGTMVIFTQMSGFAVLNASTMCASASESGGVWLVQNLTSAASAAQLPPVTALGSALAPASAEAEAEADAPALSEAAADAAVDSDAAADGAATDAAAEAAPPEAAGLEVLEVHAARTTTMAAARTDRLNGLGTELMAPPAPSLDRRDPCPGITYVRPKNLRLARRDVEPARRR